MISKMVREKMNETCMSTDRSKKKMNRTK